MLSSLSKHAPVILKPIYLSLFSLTLHSLVSNAPQGGATAFVSHLALSQPLTIMPQRDAPKTQI